MGLASIADQNRAIRNRLAILNPLRGELGLPAIEFSDAKKIRLPSGVSGNPQAEDDANHHIRLGLRQYRLSLDRQISETQTALQNVRPSQSPTHRAGAAPRYVPFSAAPAARGFRPQAFARPAAFGSGASGAASGSGGPDPSIPVVIGLALLAFFLLKRG